VDILTLGDYAEMPKRLVRPSPKPKPPKHFIREWRKHRGLTQQQLADRVEMTVSSINQIESYKQGLSDETLAALAYALGCENRGDLLSRDPNAPDYQAWQLIAGLKPEKQRQALKILRALADDDAA